VPWFYYRKQLLKRNPRYQQIDKRVQKIYRQAKANSPPTFIFEMKRIEAASNLKGGEIHLF
jgi:hypothetical protein